MADTSILTNHDYGALAQLKNAVFEPVAANPTTDCNGDPLGPANAGLLIYNSTDGQFRYWDGAAWVDFADTTSNFACQELTQSLSGGAAATTLTFTQLSDICLFQARDSTGARIEVCWSVSGANTVDVESVCDLTNAVFVASGPAA